MKKIFLTLIFGALLATACQKDPIVTDNIALKGDYEVTFDVELESEPLSRSEQEPTPNRFIMELYALSAEGATIPADSEPIATLNEGSGSFTASLNANTHYAALFWADYTITGGYNGYNVEDLRRVTIEEPVTAPAYSGSVRFTYDPEADEKPYLSNVLTHAVAQVNFTQTTAIESAQNSLSITFPKTYSLNIDGAVATEITDPTTLNSFTTFAIFNEVAADELFYTCYVIAEQEYATEMDLSYQFNNNAEQRISGVELQRNYCTNVSGDFSDPKAPEVDPTQCITINDSPKGVFGAAMAAESVSTMIQLSPALESDALLANVTEYAGISDYNYFVDILSNRSQSWDLDLTAAPPTLAEDEYFQIQIFKSCEYSACEFDNCSFNYYTLSVGNLYDTPTISASYSEHNSSDGAEEIPLTITSGRVKMSYESKHLILSIDVVCEGGHSFGVEYSGSPATKVPVVGEFYNGLGEIWKISDDGTKAWLWKYVAAPEEMDQYVYEYPYADRPYADTKDKECGMANMKTAWDFDPGYALHHSFRNAHQENLMLNPNFDGATYAAGLKNAYYLPAIDEFGEFARAAAVSNPTLFDDIWQMQCMMTSTGENVLLQPGDTWYVEGEDITDLEYYKYIYQGAEMSGGELYYIGDYDTQDIVVFMEIEL